VNNLGIHLPRKKAIQEKGKKRKEKGKQKVCTKEEGCRMMYGFDILICLVWGGYD